MNPTAAPWAMGPPPTAASGPKIDSDQGFVRKGHHTGSPVRPLINSEPAFPSVRPGSWPATWEPATKRIRSTQDVQRALKGSSLRNFMSFALSLNQAVVGSRLCDECFISSQVQALISALDTLSQFCKETPPVTHAVRYGNPSYREWFKKMQEVAPELVYDLLGEQTGPAVVEVLPYFLDSFGNCSRIDYGTGHETNFIAFLYCLACLGVFSEQDCKALVLRAFKRYLDLMQEIQTTYWLEPAGSHGVWGLDEYHFFSFIFGAAQLQDHPIIKPLSITDDTMLEDYASDFLYMDAVKFVREVKKGPLHETSPLLYDISGVPNWSKVNQGLVKMYQVEVLSKLPIMQHTLWGSLLPFPGDVETS